MIKTICHQCSKGFLAKPSWIKNGYGKFCSRACSYSFHRTGQLMDCFLCGIKTYKKPKALKGSRSGKFFCSKSCQTKWRNTEFKGEKHSNWKEGLHAYQRIIRQSDKVKVCGLCGTHDDRVLAVHHVDKNRKNNTIENLEWLCHNCHHLVHHHPHEYEKFMAIIV